MKMCAGSIWVRGFVSVKADIHKTGTGFFKLAVDTLRNPYPNETNE